MTTILRTVSLGLALIFAAPAFANDNVEFYGERAAAFASGVKVLSGRPLYFTSGGNSNAKDGPTMKEQALATMKRLEANIATAGYGIADVAFVRAYLRPGPAGAVDYDGWDAAWGEVFNGANAPVKPARTTVAVPAPNQNGALIEIEYVCATRNPGIMAAESGKQALPVANPNLKPFGTKEARILTGMGVMPDTGLYWTAGLTAPLLKADAPATSYESRGDMRTQARNTLEALKKNIAGVGLTMADVVFVRAFIGPDHNAGGKFDIDGWNAAYSEFFNHSEQPHKPARVTMTTPTFASNAGGQPNAMIEIEFVAAFGKASETPFAGSKSDQKALLAYGAPSAMFSSGVAVKPGKALYLSSSVLPTAGGDMKAQALSVLETLKSSLAAAGAGFPDVAFLRAYLVPAADGSVDRDGWNQAYMTFFNNPSQPHKPARVTIPVASLPKSDAKIAIDLIAVVP